MKRSGIFAPVFLCLGIAMGLHAQTPTPVAVQTFAPSIVTLSFNNAVLGTAEAQRELATVQSKFAHRENRR